MFKHQLMIRRTLCKILCGILFGFGWYKISMWCHLSTKAVTLTEIYLGRYPNRIDFIWNGSATWLTAVALFYYLDCFACVCTVYLKKYAHGFVVLCFDVVMQSFIMNSHELFIHIHQGCFADTGAIVRLPQCHWSKPDGYGKISQCITTTKHSKTKTVSIFLGIYCIRELIVASICSIHLLMCGIILTHVDMFVPSAFLFCIKQYH